MPTCFVMQPFDGGTFDGRYDQVFKAAIEAAGLDPYRVDKDASANVPIEAIERGIRECQVCLADITQDNPNVWFELGFAFACNKQVVMVCSDERTSPKFPFDVQHRAIIKYSTKLPSDYAKVGGQITEKLIAYLEKTDRLASASEVAILSKFDGLDQHEVVALATLAENLDHPEDSVSVGILKRDLETAGQTKIATAIALRSLQTKALVFGSYKDSEYDGQQYYAYELTDSGWQWVVANKDKFTLELPRAPRPIPKGRTPASRSTGFDDMDDDIPF